RTRRLRVSPPIGEALPADASQGLVCALVVSDAEGDALVVAEIEFRQIALQVLLADVVIGAVDAALEDREIALDRVGVGLAANVFLDPVVDGVEARELGR